MALSKRDRAVLDFERGWWQLPGPKEAAIRERLGFSSGQYYKLLGHLVDDPDGEAYDPLTVKRLRRDRERRRRARFEGREVDPRQR